VERSSWTDKYSEVSAKRESPEKNKKEIVS